MMEGFHHLGEDFKDIVNIMFHLSITFTEVASDDFGVTYKSEGSTFTDAFSALEYKLKNDVPDFDEHAEDWENLTFHATESAKSVTPNNSTAILINFGFDYPQA